MQLLAAAALLGRELFHCVDAGLIGEELLGRITEQLLSMEHMEVKSLFVRFGSFHIPLYETMLCLSIKEGSSVPQFKCEPREKPCPCDRSVICDTAVPWCASSSRHWTCTYSPFIPVNYE